MTLTIWPVNSSSLFGKDVDKVIALGSSANRHQSTEVNELCYTQIVMYSDAPASQFGCFSTASQNSKSVQVVAYLSTEVGFATPRQTSIVKAQAPSHVAWGAVPTRMAPNSASNGIKPTVRATSSTTLPLKSASILPAQTSPPENKNRLGAIVGSTVGGIAVLLVLLVLLIFLLNHKTKAVNLARATELKALETSPTTPPVTTQADKSAALNFDTVESSCQEGIAR
jgi:hypothetical protein